MAFHRTAWLLVALALATAQGAFAYTIVLKNGTKLEAARKYAIRPDGKAVVTMADGSTRLLEVAEIDVKKTEELNRANDDSVVVVDASRPGAPTAQGARPTLQDLRARPSEVERAPAVRDTPLPTRAAEPVAAPGGVRRPLADANLAASLEGAFRSNGVDSVKISAGADGRRPLAEVATPNEAAIFRALEAAAQALVTARLTIPESASALELSLSTPGGDRAGQFVITPEQAQDLVGGKIDPARFFVKYVQF